MSFKVWSMTILQQLLKMIEEIWHKKIYVALIINEDFLKRKHKYSLKINKKNAHSKIIIKKKYVNSKLNFSVLILYLSYNATEKINKKKKLNQINLQFLF